MTDDRDPTLRVLFADATQDFAGAAFTAQVMAQTKLRYSAVAGRIGVSLVLASCAWLLATPLQDAVHLVAQNLAPLSMVVSLIDVDNRWLAQMLSPVNNIASMTALGLVGLRIAYKKVYS